MRSINPTSGPVVRFTNSYVKMGDCMGGVVVTIIGIMAVIFTAGPLADYYSAWFSLLFMLILIPIAIYSIWWSKAKELTTNMSHEDENVINATRHYAAIRGTFEEAYALPLVNQIWDHACDFHGEKSAPYWDRTCNTCQERNLVLAQLRPKGINSYNSKAELEEAKNFINNRNKMLNA